jgi:hypothetical protein
MQFATSQASAGTSLLFSKISRSGKESSMRCLAAIVLLGCLALAGCQHSEGGQDSDLLFQDRNTWFSAANNGDQLLPQTANDAKPAAKNP